LTILRNEETHLTQ